MKVYVPEGSSVGASLSAQKAELVRPHRILKFGTDNRRIHINEAREYDWIETKSFVEEHSRFKSEVECPAYYVPTLSYLIRQTHRNCTSYTKIVNKLLLHLWMRMGGDHFVEPAKIRKRGILSKEDMKTFCELDDCLGYDFELTTAEIEYVSGLGEVRIVSDRSEGLFLAQLLCLPFADSQLLGLGCVLESEMDGLRAVIRGGAVWCLDTRFGQLNLDYQLVNAGGGRYLPLLEGQFLAPGNVSESEIDEPEVVSGKGNVSSPDLCSGQSRLPFWSISTLKGQ